MLRTECEIVVAHTTFTVWSPPKDSLSFLSFLFFRPVFMPGTRVGHDYKGLNTKGSPSRPQLQCNTYMIRRHPVQLFDKYQ
jgi:hypothetical protein